MPVLNVTPPFAGRHWETGAVANALALRGLTAPHTGQPYSEALLAEGRTALDRMRAINARLAAIRAGMGTDFPLDAAGVNGLLESIAAHVQRLHDLEAEAVAALQAAMA